MLKTKILYFLSLKAASGYDLEQRLNLFKPIWGTVHRSQVYRELGHLVKDGYITSVNEKIGRYPEKSIFSLTAAGGALLKRLLTEDIPDSHDEANLDLLTFFGSKNTSREMDALLTRIDGLMDEKIKEYKELSKKLGDYSMETDHPEERMFWELTVRKKIDAARAIQNRNEETRRYLKEHGKWILPRGQFACLAPDGDLK